MRWLFVDFMVTKSHAFWREWQRTTHRVSGGLPSRLHCACGVAVPPGNGLTRSHLFLRSLKKMQRIGGGSQVSYIIISTFAQTHTKWFEDCSATVQLRTIGSKINVMFTLNSPLREKMKEGGDLTRHSTGRRRRKRALHVLIAVDEERKWVRARPVCEGGSEHGDDAGVKLIWRNRATRWLLRSAITRRGARALCIWDMHQKCEKSTRSTYEQKFHSESLISP